MIGVFIKRGDLVKDEAAKALSKAYLEKAKTNIITMELLSKAKAFKDALSLPADYSSDEWVIVAAYYSMYLAALSLLAKLGFRSKNHTATSAALEEFFIKRKLLDSSYLSILEKVRLKKEEIETLREAKDRREIAQYSVTKKLAAELAEETKQDAHKFVDKVEETLELLS